MVGVSATGGCDRSGADGGKDGGGVAAAHPNIIFVLVDTLRADRLGPYGDGRGLSPFVDELAAEGVTFERAIAAAPWTLPSVGSLFTGYWPTVHKLGSYSQERDAHLVEGGQVPTLSEDFTTLAEALQEVGYETAAFVANPFITRKYGFAQGFDHFDGSFAGNLTPAPIVTTAALAWLDARPDKSKPVFLYLHYMDVHDPYRASAKHLEPLIAAVEAMPNKRRLTTEELQRHRGLLTNSAREYAGKPRHRELFPFMEYWQARYDAGVAEVNEHLLALRGGLQERDLWDDSYIVFVADHGESLGEHQIWAHGFSNHQDQAHVPLVLRWPAKLPAGARVETTVRLFDVMPTIVEQVGGKLPNPVQARSLGNLLAEKVDEAARPALVEAVKRAPDERALVLENWKILGNSATDTFALFNLDTDPHEQQDVAIANPETVSRLREQLARIMAENEALSEAVQLQVRTMTSDERDIFQTLGYVGNDEPAPAATQPSDKGG